MLDEVKLLKRQKAVGKPPNWLQRINNHNVTKARLQLSCAFGLCVWVPKPFPLFFLQYLCVTYMHVRADAQNHQVDLTVVLCGERRQTWESRAQKREAASPSHQTLRAFLKVSLPLLATESSNKFTAAWEVEGAVTQSIDVL